MPTCCSGVSTRRASRSRSTSPPRPGRPTSWRRRSARRPRPRSGRSCCSPAELGRRLRVGPESAGALPGPACYGAGGPLTLTDANLLLGRLDAAGFEIPIDEPAAARAADELAAQVGETTAAPEREDLLLACLEIANERMAEAIREVSVRSEEHTSELQSPC